jgi:hypothetical protein
VRNAGGILQGKLSDYLLVDSMKVAGSRNVTESQWALHSKSHNLNVRIV